MEFTEQEKKQIHLVLRAYKALIIKYRKIENGKINSIQSKLLARETFIKAIFVIVDKLPENSKLKDNFIKNKAALNNKRIDKNVFKEIKHPSNLEYYNHSLEHVIFQILDHVISINESLPTYKAGEFAEHFFQKPEDIFKMMLFQLHHIFKNENQNFIWPKIINIIFCETEFKKYFSDKEILNSFIYSPPKINIKKISIENSPEYLLKKRLLNQLNQWQIQCKKFKHPPLVL